MKEPNNTQYNKNLNSIRSAFEKASAHYDEYSILQRTITDRLTESLDEIKIKPISILDLGSGTGYGSKILHKKFKDAHIYQIDVSEGMLNMSHVKAPVFFSKDHFICADANKLPFRENYFDLIVSGLMLQWCNNFDTIFAEVNNLLKVNGVFLFSSLGPDSLKELRDCWACVDDYVHVNAFVDMHDIGDALIRNELISPVLNTEKIILTYNSCRQLMCELKYIGAQNVNNGRRKTLTGKNRLKKVFEHYEAYRANKKLPATYEVIYGHAWKSAPRQQTQSVTLEEVKQQLKKRQ